MSMYVCVHLCRYMCVFMYVCEDGVGWGMIGFERKRSEDGGGS